MVPDVAGIGGEDQYPGIGIESRTARQVFDRQHRLVAGVRIGRGEDQVQGFADRDRRVARLDFRQAVLLGNVDHDFTGRLQPARIDRGNREAVFARLVEGRRPAEGSIGRIKGCACGER